ncbi:MAG: PHP domain-containing protein, partial [Draconibacterium sp.]|nr:PHP domain-containing protein [Draconibacterium sp.]
MKNLFFLFLLVCITSVSFSQTIKETRENSPKFEIPDIPGYFTMKCDFHMHTVFSDGKVWPDVRVNEALAEGLDAISITDHVEKKREGVDDNHVMGYEIAKKTAEGKDIVIVSGGEISASKDHYNALFLKNQDAKDLRDKKPANRIAAANNQGAFVFWNHPGWTSKYKDGNTPHDDEFVSLLKNGQVKGIEICNGDGYWEDAHKMALENNLTLIGNSDI